MSKKSPAIAALLAEITAAETDLKHAPHYVGYFACFNRELFYEAHDVLEELWLPCRREADGDFYKGLIQFAGAFVHLKKGRLQPASNLFALAEGNLQKYPSPHCHLDLAEIIGWCREYRRRLAESDYAVNPWTPGHAPRMKLIA